MLELQSVDVYYGQAQALFGLSLRVEAGEWVSIIGANGAGKTTTIKTIMGLVTARRGKILFNGRDITNLPPWERVELGISYVPEGRRIFPELTVEENLRLGAFRLTNRDPRLKEGFERVYQLFPRLAERRRQLGRTLSGGEQQMLALGRALMPGPRLLLIDEISMGLMPLAVNQAFHSLWELNRQGMTILLVEQNARKAIGYATRGYVLETGRLVLAGTAAELAENPRVREAYLGG
ncbi:MAG: ABC transporter ATP-binding protein [Firmicutes bacterium]|nr:ABC transporter ATP-binding protein [Bacillota bacterium]